MLLKDKVAIVYGAGGIGRAVSLAYARAGARLFLANRSAKRLDKLAADIRADGHTVETKILDVHDQVAVDAYVDDIAARAKRIDISFNVVGLGDVQKPLMEISTDDFVQPVANSMRAHINTGRAAARHMIRQKSGVLLVFGGGGIQTEPGLGGFKIALDALEGLRHQWAKELSQYGIRVLTLKSAGVPESLSPIDDIDKLTRMIEGASPMHKAANFEDVGNVAVFAASDHASSITDTWLNIGYGTLVD